MESIYDDKIIQLEKDILGLQESRNELNKSKKAYELNVAELNLTLKGGWLKQDIYNSVSRTKFEIMRKTSELDEKLRRNNLDIQKKSIEKDELQKKKKALFEEQIKYDPVLNGLSELREKYLAFAADKRMISSMRQMAAEFVTELEMVIKSQK